MGSFRCLSFRGMSTALRAAAENADVVIAAVGEYAAV